MPPPPRAREALQFMKSMGFSSKDAAPVLKKLLKVYDNNWEHIEDNNYQLLVNSMLEEQEIKAEKQDDVAVDDSEFIRKRPRLEADVTPEVDGDMPEFGVPIAMAPPDHPMPVAVGYEAHQFQQSQGDPSLRVISSWQTNNAEYIASQNADKGTKGSPHRITSENGKTSEYITIASSNTGVVRLMLSFKSDGATLRMPDLDAFLKLAEERCLKHYKLQPDFSLLKVMKDVCQVASDLATTPSNDQQEKLSESIEKFSFPIGATQNVHGMENDGEKRKEPGALEKSTTSFSSVVFQQPQVAFGDLRPPHDLNDIAKGAEKAKIPVVNEVSNEKYPLSFNYIPRNHVYKNACVNISLARIGDEDCCPDCFTDCVVAAIPCPCAKETGGEFAYTSDGLVRETLLDACVSMSREPNKHPHVYCQDCPLERSKNGAIPTKCKGHLVRKFIKECWSKCGCKVQCKNRIVQRGITCKLQVFFTPEGKGWGLRTLTELPRGAFVCEYVGEVLTTMEFNNRTIECSGNAKHIRPVILDANWGSKRILKDEEALCLDATFYGNVARFLNHRCVDANLVEIPVEVETPDRLYYHLAFFTTRKIEKFEELTWDYGIDFNEVDHPFKVFRCRCGSKFCRDMKRSKTRSKALVLA